MFISDNVATQIDGLAHITAGSDYHWYNGFKESEWGGDWGPRKCDASDDSADHRPGRAGRRRRLSRSLTRCRGTPGSREKTSKTRSHGRACALAPGDVVLVRTGTGRFWGEDGADHAKIGEHDSAGVDLEGTKWLVEDQGAIMVGSDTRGYEVNPAPDSPGTQRR